MDSNLEPQPTAAVPCRRRAEDHLTPQETAILERYGGWLRSLADGTRAPSTPEQMQFVRVAHGELEPQTPFELAWCKSQRLKGGTSVPSEVHRRLENLSAARATLEALLQKLEQRRQEILERVRPMLTQLEAEFVDCLNDAKQELDVREKDARQAVLEHGVSCLCAGIKATYSRPRTTWDAHGLAEYAQSHPEVARFRRVGNPTVSLRYLPAAGVPLQARVKHLPQRSE